MSLSSELISQFVKVTKDEKKTQTSTAVKGTVVKSDRLYVRLDGSELLTPVTTTASVKDGDRVSVTIENHTASITGNITDPSASTVAVSGMESKIEEIDTVVANKVSTEVLEAEKARIDDLVAENITVKGRIDAAEGYIKDLTADNLTINGKLTANAAEIENLKATKIDADVIEATYATIENLEATNVKIYNLEATYGEFEVLTTERLDAVDGKIENLEATTLTAEKAELKYAKIETLKSETARIDDLYANTLTAADAELKYAKIETLDSETARINDLYAKKLDADSAEIKYANIDFANITEAAVRKIFSDSGIIKDLIVSDGKITGELVGVTIKGDLIEAGTLKADRLVVLGSDGNYYKLNTDFEAMPGIEPVEEDQIHGSTLVKKSIVAEKIAVDDLVAFGATIGGFKITSDAIYSGVKTSPTNTTRGIYMDNAGQWAIGDANNFLRYYKDQNGKYKLEISANSISMSAGGSTVQDEIDSIRDEMATIKDEVTTLLRIESSRGTVFKNDQVATVLSAVIYRGNTIIRDIETLKSVMGSGAYLEWSWQHLNDESYGVISADDYRIGNGGFTFTLNPDDVDTKVTFVCTLNT